MFTMYTIVFVTMIALAVNVYLIGNALLQQRNTVEYVAMSVLKVADDPVIPLPGACLQDELSYLNCVLKRAEVAGQVAIGGSNNNSFYLPSGKLQMKARGSDSSCCKGGGGRSGCNFDGGDNSPTSGGGEDEKGNFCWPAYQIVDEGYAELMMGTYSVEKGSFRAAEPNAVQGRNFNAIKLRFHFNPTNENTKMIAPLIGLFGRNMQLRFSSSALAYRTPNGSIHLAIDPTLSM